MRTIATFLLFASIGGVAVFGQTPTPPGALPPLRMPEPIQPKPNDPKPVQTDEKIVDQIRGALETGRPAAAPGILGDVLEVIRQRGSILDGSVLDPKNENPLETKEQPTQGSDPGVDRRTPTLKPSNVRVAESLLRSARLLESIPGGDEDRRALVRKMRIQATRLLVQTYPL